MNRIPTYVPYVNRPDLMTKACLSLVGSQTDLYIIDNSGEDLSGKDFHNVFRPVFPMTFSQSQNCMFQIADALNVPFYLFLHSDAEAGEGTVDNLIDMARRMTDEGTRWGVIFTSYDALAAFNVEAFKAVGGWDENLPWYLSDCDMYRRLRLAGYPTFESGLPVKHTPSRTLNSDPAIAKMVHEQTPNWRNYYRQKWGGDNEHEVYQTPFNI